MTSRSSWPGLSLKPRSHFRSGDFARPGGYEALKMELDYVWLEYLDLAKDDEFGPRAESVLIDFKENQVC